MKFKMLLLALFVGTLFFTACEEESSEDIEKTYELAGFTEIDLGDAFQIEISKGNTYEVKAQGTTRNINDLQLKVVNGRLTGKYEPSRNNRKRTEITIQLPKLTYLKLSGATDTNLKGFYSPTESLKLVVEGASKLDATMEWKALDLNVNGASLVTLDGVTPTVEAEISGTCTFFGNNFRTRNFKAIVSGVSKANVNVIESLSGSASGNSELRYLGNPTNVQVEVSGNSKLSKL